jgi:hypothetical protein
MVVAAVLALFWLWTGVACHWLAFAAINPAAWLFGALYVGEAALLLWYGLRAARLQFGYRPGLHSAIGLLFMAYAAIAYPFLGFASSHAYPNMPMFGMTPCPLTIFTLGLFLLARSVPWPVLIVPVLWSLIGGTAAFLLHVPQDWLLLLSGLATLALLWRVSGAAA